MLYIVIKNKNNLIVVIGLAYYILMKKMGKSEYRQMKKLQEGTKAETFSMDIFFQKLYMIYINKLELLQLVELEQIYILQKLQWT